MGQCDCWTSNDGPYVFPGPSQPQTGKKIKDMETKKSEQTNRVEPKKSERQSTSRQRAANGSDSMASGVGSPVAGLGLRKLPPIVHVKLPSVVTFDESIRVATAEPNRPAMDRKHAPNPFLVHDDDEDDDDNNNTNDNNINNDRFAAAKVDSPRPPPDDTLQPNTLRLSSLICQLNKASIQLSPPDLGKQRPQTPASSTARSEVSWFSSPLHTTRTDISSDESVAAAPHSPWRRPTQTQQAQLMSPSSQRLIAPLFTPRSPPQLAIPTKPTPVIRFRVHSPRTARSEVEPRSARSDGGFGTARSDGSDVSQTTL